MLADLSQRHSRIIRAEDCARAAHKFNTHFFQGKPRVQVAVPALCEVIGSNDPDEGMGSTVPYSGEYVLMLPDLPTEEVKKFLFSSPLSKKKKMLSREAAQVTQQTPIRLRHVGQQNASVESPLLGCTGIAIHAGCE